MAFASAVTRVEVVGRQRRAYGTWTNAAGDSGGAIATGLRWVAGFNGIPTSHFGAPVMKATLNSASAGQVTIVTGDNVDGNWEAWGI